MTWASRCGSGHSSSDVRRHLALVVAAVALLGCTPGPADREVPARASDPTFLTITNDPLGPLLLGSTGGGFTSRDAGRSWQPLPPARVPALAQAETHRGVLVSLGPQWIEYDLALEREVTPVTRWPGDRRIVALAASATLKTVWALATGPEPRMLRSRDEGATWTEIVPTGLCRQPRGLAATGPREDGKALLYAACGPRGLLVSDNGGLSFERVPGIRNARDVAVCLRDPLVVVVATPLVRVSRDGGRTWIDGRVVADRVAVDPRNPDLVFAIAPNGRLFASKDGGRTF